MKQFVIYSACIGSYDNISQPKYIDDRFDYILFTDELKEKHIGVWEVRKVDYSNSDKTSILRVIVYMTRRIGYMDWIPKSRFSIGAISFEVLAIPDTMVCTRQMCCIEPTMSK